MQASLEVLPTLHGPWVQDTLGVISASSLIPWRSEMKSATQRTCWWLLSPYLAVLGFPGCFAFRLPQHEVVDGVLELLVALEQLANLLTDI